MIVEYDPSKAYCNSCEKSKPREEFSEEDINSATHDLFCKECKPKQEYIRKYLP